MPFLAIRGAAFERRKRTKSLGLPHREAGVFIVFVGVPDILLSLHPKSNFKDMGQKEDIEKVTSKIILIRDTQVIIDRDVAELYGVTTREINQALKNNPRKFPSDFVIELTNSEKQEVIKNFDNLKGLKFSRVAPHAFTEQGLYMLATILKGDLATDTSLAIVRTFTKLRQLSRAMQQVNEEVAKGGEIPDENKQGVFKNLMNEVFADPLPVKVQKMTFGINIGIFKWELETTRERKD